MGCDIHFHTEIKVEGKWLHYGHPRIPRNYALFAKLAGVRNRKEWGIEPISNPRGLPDDVNETTWICADYDGSDGHSHSYITSNEVSKLYEWMDSEEYPFASEGWKLEMNNWDYLFGNSWDIVKHSSKPEFVEDVRFVFWFDN